MEFKWIGHTKRGFKNAKALFVKTSSYTKTHWCLVGKDKALAIEGVGRQIAID